MTNNRLPLSPDNHSLSSRWLTSKNVILFIRWPFFQPRRLDPTMKLGRRIGERRRIAYYMGKDGEYHWMPYSDLK